MCCKLLVVRPEHKVVGWGGGGAERGCPLHRGVPKGAVLHMYCKHLVVGPGQGLMTTHMYQDVLTLMGKLGDHMVGPEQGHIAEHDEWVRIMPWSANEVLCLSVSEAESAA